MCLSILKLKPALNSVYVYICTFYMKFCGLLEYFGVRYGYFASGNCIGMALVWCLCIYVHTQLHLRFHSLHSTDTISLTPFPLKSQCGKINADVDNSCFVMSIHFVQIEEASMTVCQEVPLCDYEVFSPQ